MTEDIKCITAIIVALLAVGGLVFNSGVLYNDVKHLKADVQEIKKTLIDILKKIKI